MVRFLKTMAQDIAFLHELEKVFGKNIVILHFLPKFRFKSGLFNYTIL